MTFFYDFLDSAKVKLDDAPRMAPPEMAPPGDRDMATRHAVTFLALLATEAANDPAAADTARRTQFVQISGDFLRGLPNLLAEVVSAPVDLTEIHKCGLTSGVAYFMCIEQIKMFCTLPDVPTTIDNDDRRNLNLELPPELERRNRTNLALGTPTGP